MVERRVPNAYHAIHASAASSARSTPRPPVNHSVNRDGAPSRATGIISSAITPSVISSQARGNDTHRSGISVSSGVSRTSSMYSSVTAAASQANVALQSPLRGHVNRTTSPGSDSPHRGVRESPVKSADPAARVSTVAGSRVPPLRLDTIREAEVECTRSMMANVHKQQVRDRSGLCVFQSNVPSTSCAPLQQNNGSSSELSDESQPSQPGDDRRTVVQDDLALGPTPAAKSSPVTVKFTLHDRTLVLPHVTSADSVTYHVESLV